MNISKIEILKKNKKSIEKSINVWASKKIWGKTSCYSEMILDEKQCFLLFSKLHKKKDKISQKNAFTGGVL